MTLYCRAHDRYFKKIFVRTQVCLSKLLKYLLSQKFSNRICLYNFFVRMGKREEVLNLALLTGSGNSSGFWKSTEPCA